MPAAVVTDPSIVPANLEQLLHAAYSRFDFDTTLLLPMRRGEFVDGYRQGLSLKQSHQPDNLWLLACYDIGVVCGSRSHNLAAIRFRAEKDRTDFLAQNPALQGALLTSSPGSFCVWVRIEGWYPENHEHPVCNWIADKLVLIAARQPNSQLRFDNTGHPVMINFREIVWAPDLAMYWASKLAGMEYEIVVEDKRGNPVVNDDFIGSMFMNLHANIRYNPVAGTFYRRLPDCPIQMVYDEEVKQSLHTVLAYIRQVAKRPGPKAAGKAIGRRPLFVDTGLKQLAALLELLKILAVKPVEAVPTVIARPSFDQEEANGFEEFILTQLEEAPGENVTVEEIHSAYVDHCLRGELPRYSARQFRDRLGEAVKKEFSIQKAHDILRDGHAKRGFRNIRLKGQEAGSRIETFRTERTNRTVFFEDLDKCHSNLTAYLATAM